MRKWILVVVAVVLLGGPLTTVLGDENAVAPALLFSASEGLESLTVEGGTSGADLVLLGVGRTQVGYLPTTSRFTGRVAVDDIGAATFPLGRPVPRWSIWVAVDLSTGALSFSTPDVALVRELDPQDPETTLPNLGASFDVLDDARRRLEILVVRPEQGVEGKVLAPEEAGAWMLSLGDGGASDRDGEADGQILLSMLDLRPVGDSPPSPEKLAPGDLVIGIDGESLDYYTLRIAAPAVSTGSAFSPWQGGE